MEEESARAAAIEKAQRDREEALKIAENVMSQIHKDQEESKNHLIDKLNLKEEAPPQCRSPESDHVHDDNKSGEGAKSVAKSESNEVQLEDAMQKAASSGCGCIIS